MMVNDFSRVEVPKFPQDHTASLHDFFSLVKNRVASGERIGIYQIHVDWGKLRCYIYHDGRELELEKILLFPNVMEIVKFINGISKEFEVIIHSIDKFFVIFWG